MDETDQASPKLVEGFNHGYLLGEYAPALAEKLSKINAVSPHIIGLQKGYEQYQKDQLRTKLPNWLKDNPTPDRTNTPSKDQNKQIDKE